MGPVYRASTLFGVIRVLSVIRLSLPTISAFVRKVPNAQDEILIDSKATVPIYGELNENPRHIEDIE